MNHSATHPVATLEVLLRHLRLMVTLLSLVFCGLPVLAADYASLVSQANEQLQDDRFVEALASANDAVRANPNDYKGHYYVALAYLGMDRFDDAETAASRALSLSPVSAKAGVEKLASAIKTRRLGTTIVQAADAAMADGLLGKAARLYEQAWGAGKDTPELGLKAADLYAYRLDQPIDAARVLRQVQAAAKGNPSAEKARAALAKLSTVLRDLAKAQVQAAKTAASPDAAMRSLQQAEEADPGYADIFSLRAQLAAKGNNAQALQSAIKDLARRQLAEIDSLADLPRMSDWLQQPGMAEFLTDILGVKKMETLLPFVQQSAAQVASQVPMGSPAAGQSIKDCAHCPEMVVIPAGRFQMGNNDAKNEADEKPMHSVTVKRFAIGKYEVTQGQWKAVMGSNPSLFNTCGNNCPVQRVSWNDIQGFIQKLNQKTGQQYRLPTEAEWEYACRGGGQQKYCGSEDVNAVGWYEENSRGEPQAVGQKAANGFGLHDMSGNVWEWVQDGWHNNYQGAPSDGSEWVAGAGTERVLRGGSWGNDPALLRSAFRFRYSPDNRNVNFGFRLARTLFTP